MFSIICVYRDKKILENFLLKSLKNQTVNYELILIDNTKQCWASAAKALNYGGRQAKEKYLMFVHYDIDLCSNTWLEDAEKILDSLPNLGISGIAGARKPIHFWREEIITNIKHGSPPKIAGDVRLQKPERVQTLDENLVIIPKKVFNNLSFDEKTCDDWHLYAVDYCLSIKKLGFEVYVIPMFAYHWSAGIPNKNFFPIMFSRIIFSLGWLSKSYYRILKKILKKHKNSYKYIATTAAVWNTSSHLVLQKIKYLFKKPVQLLLRKF